VKVSKALCHRKWVLAHGIIICLLDKRTTTHHIPEEENKQQPKTMKLAAFLLASSIIIVSAAASDDSKMVRGGGGVVATADDVDVDAIKATKHNVLRGVNFFKAIAEGEYVAGRNCDATTCPGCARLSCPPNVMICGVPCDRQNKPCEQGYSCVDCDSDTYRCLPPDVL
jgi:hypothetical protein